MPPVSRLFLASLFFLCTTVLFAQDRHLGNDPASNLYAHSAFAHGYIHGYEAGFHSGDLDVQLGRNARNPESLAGFKHSGDDFHAQFGSKESFKAGYKDGFLAGYSDAVDELSFRAIASLRKAAMNIDIPSKGVPQFDKGFKEGYEDGRHQGADDGRESAASDPVQPPCLLHPASYCSGFSRGFMLGYSDGYENQTASRPVLRSENGPGK